MTDLLAGALIRYVELSLLLGLAFLLFQALRRLSGVLRVRLGYSGLSRLGRALFLTTLLSPIAAHLLLTWWPAASANSRLTTTRPAAFSAGAHVAQQDTEVLIAEALLPGSAGERARSLLHGLQPWQVEFGVSLAAMFLLSGFAVGGLRTLGQLRRLRALVGESTPLRRIGRVSVVVSDRACVPFSTAVFGRAHVVLPVDLVQDAGLLSVALRHELQHYRRADPSWAVVLEAFRLFFFWHPGARGWVRELSDLQELSCDEALVLRGIPPKEYGTCLLRVAEMALRQRLVASTAMATYSDRGAHLRRRIDMLFRYDRNHGSRRWSFGVSVGCVLVILGLAVASAGNLPSVGDLTTDTATWYTDDPLAIRIEVLAQAHAATLRTVSAKPAVHEIPSSDVPVELGVTAELESLQSFLASLILEPDMAVTSVTVRGPQPGDSRVQAGVEFVLQREQDEAPMSVAEGQETIDLIRSSLELMVQEDLSELRIDLDGEAATLFVKNRDGTSPTDFAEATPATEVLREMLEPVTNESRRKAPDIEFETPSGTPLRLSAMRGKVVLIDFWASWCIPCEKEVEQLRTLERDLGREDFAIVGVSLSEDRASFESFVAEHRVPWPQRHEDGGWGTSAARAYGVQAIPSHFLVDREGRYVRVPLGTPQQLAQIISEFLNE